MNGKETGKAAARRCIWAGVACPPAEHVACSQARRPLRCALRVGVEASKPCIYLLIATSEVRDVRFLKYADANGTERGKRCVPTW